MKRELIYIAIIVVLVNVLIWLLIPPKNDPDTKRELEYIQEQIMVLEDSISGYEENIKKQDSITLNLEEQLKKSRNDLWWKKQEVKKLRNSKPTISILDSLRIARREG